MRWISAYHQSKWVSRKVYIDTQQFTSYLDIESENEGRLKTKLYDKRDVFTFLIVNFPFISRHTPGVPAGGDYISQLIRYSKACAQYCDVLERAQMLTKKLLWLLYGRHYNLVDRYKNEVLKWQWIFSLFCRLFQQLVATRLPSVLTIWVRRRVSCGKHEIAYPSRAPVFCGINVANFFSFLFCVFFK